VTAVALSGGAGAHDPAWFCVDAAGMKTTTDYVPVWERGFRGMSGYVTHLYDIPQACIEAWWELPDTWWMMNVEGDPHAGLGGAAVGAQYARDGIAAVRDKGHLRETALVFSLVDFGPTSSQFPILDETHHAAVDVCMEDNQTPGFYGPPVYLRHLAVQPWVPAGTVFWQWGGGGAPEWWTTVKQAGPSSDPAVVHTLDGFGFGADENLLWTPMAGWTGYGAQPPDPPHPSALSEVPTVAGHICFAQRLDGSYVEVVSRKSDGNHRWRHVGDIPGGAGTFYAVHPPDANGVPQGVHQIGDNEIGAMGVYDAADDTRNEAAMFRAAGGTGVTAGTPVDLSPVVAAAQQVEAAAQGLVNAIQALPSA
jgi:hypothetical protein